MSKPLFRRAGSLCPVSIPRLSKPAVVKPPVHDGEIPPARTFSPVPSSIQLSDGRTRNFAGPDGVGSRPRCTEDKRWFWFGTIPLVSVALGGVVRSRWGAPRPKIHRTSDTRSFPEPRGLLKRPGVATMPGLLCLMVAFAPRTNATWCADRAVRNATLEPDG